MLGVVWETRGKALVGPALPRTASLCCLYTPCSRWLCSSRACTAEAFSSRTCCWRARAFWRMNSRKDAGLYGWPRNPRGFGQGGGSRASFSCPGAS